MKPRKILIMGLPGAGKTTLARALERSLQARRVPVTIIDGDAVRAFWHDVDFSEEGRVKQARRIGGMASDLVQQGLTTLCSFVCPTPDARHAFWDETPDEVVPFTVFVDRVTESAYPDTNRMFIPPGFHDYAVNAEESVGESVAAILAKLNVHTFDVQAPTALLVGRFQPFHEGHRALVEKAIDDVGQCIIGLRDTGVDENNPLTIAERTELITASLEEYAGRYMLLQLPNVTKVVYGRTPGYEIEQYKLDTLLEAISGTQRRKELRQ